MEWKVGKALNPDVERQQLNKVLADIRAAVSSVGTPSTNQTGTTTINTVTRYAVARFTLNLTGDVEGSALVDGTGDVTLETTLGDVEGLIEEAPIDSRYYWRRNGEWRPVPMDLTSNPEGEGILQQTLDDENTPITSVIADGTTGQFMRGDRAWSNTLLGPMAIVPPANTVGLDLGPVPNIAYWQGYDGVNLVADATFSATLSSAGDSISASSVGGYRSRGTHASPTSVELGDQLFYMGAYGHTGGAPEEFYEGGYLYWEVDGVVSSGVLPTKFYLGNTNYYMRLDSVGFTYLNGPLGLRIDGPLGVKTNVPAGATTLYSNAAITGATTADAVHIVSAVQSGVTSAAYGYRSTLSTQAASFTLTNLNHFHAEQGGLGLGSTVTNQNGFTAAASMVSAGTNSGFRGLLPAGANNYNLRMDGTAQNLLGGQTTIAQGPITTSQPFTITQTYNNAGVTFNSLLVNVTNTASGGSSLLADLQVGSVSKFSVNLVGAAVAATGFSINGQADGRWSAAQLELKAAGLFGWAATANAAGTMDTSMGRAGPNSIVSGPATAVAGGATTRTELNKEVTGIANATGTAILTITIPNAAHSAVLKLLLDADLGAGGAVGACEAGVGAEYLIKINRTAGVNAVATISAVGLTASANVAGAATATLTAAMSAVSGAVGASNTFTVNVTISRSGGSSTNHTCLVYAKLMNKNATGITVA